MSQKNIPHAAQICALQDRYSAQIASITRSSSMPFSSKTLRTVWPCSSPSKKHFGPQGPSPNTTSQPPMRRCFTKVSLNWQIKKEAPSSQNKPNLHTPVLSGSRKGSTQFFQIFHCLCDSCGFLLLGLRHASRLPPAASREGCAMSLTCRITVAAWSSCSRRCSMSDIQIWDP